LLRAYFWNLFGPFVDGNPGAMNLTLQQTLEKLRDSSQAAGQVQQLGELIDGELPLQGFLEQLLPHLCGLYGAQAAVAWMKIQGAVLGIRYRMDALLPTASQQKQHEKLVQIAWSQKRPLLAEPSPTALDSSASQPTTGHSDPEFSGNKNVHNPTNHRLLFAPIIHVSEPVALMEIVLPHQAGGLSNIQKQLYLKSAQLVAERIYGGLQRRMLMPEARLSEALREFNVLSGQLQAFQTQIKQTIESKLKKFHGWSFDSLAENQAFAKSLHQILESHGLRVRCPECGHPAILRCLRAGNSKNGVFVFDHYLESGRTFHGGPTTIPSLKIVAKPARRSSNSASPDA
jgi:hypothetical protein